jgi:pSer/pThr/pTyr-binding forkhead associated (FHA) protein
MRDRFDAITPGRGENAEVRVEDNQVSRLHAAVERVGTSRSPA